MELSDLLKQPEIPQGTVLTKPELHAYGLYDTGRKLGNQTVYWGVDKGVCILDPHDDGKFQVYLHTKSSLHP